MAELVFWIDVDNTLLNNDQVKENLDIAMRTEMGDKITDHFWDIYEQVRHEKDVVDIPLSLMRLRAQTSQEELDDFTFEHVFSIVENYPFVQALYPNALETLAYLRTLGIPVIVSDGDLYFQAEKVINSAIAEAVEGRVLLYTHKQEHLAEIMHLYPGEHYVMIDDKPSILIDIKQSLGEKGTTVFVKQGKYAQEKFPEHFTPDRSVEHIGDLLQFKREDFLLR